MKLYYGTPDNPLNSLIGEYDSVRKLFKDMNADIRSFLEDEKQTRYCRINGAEPDAPYDIWIDYGSWSHFFYVTIPEANGDKDLAFKMFAEEDKKNDNR